MQNNQERKRISVAMATYNGAAYLREQIASILAQELPPDEIVVCDDLSTDNTVDILKSYAEKGMLKYVVAEHKLGIVKNFKRAASLCNPENYIAFSDQDDVWLPQKLKVNYAALEAIDNKEIPALTFSDLSVVNEVLEMIHPSFWGVLRIHPSQEDITTLLFGNIVTGCTVMMNAAMRRLFCDMPDNAAIAMHDAWLALIAYTFGRHSYSGQPLLSYRQHGRNVTYESNQNNTLGRRISRAFSQISNNDAFLKKEIEQARLFLETYQARLSPEHTRAISEFISLGKASFLRKKYSSILARRYRYLTRNK